MSSQMVFDGFVTCKDCRYGRDLLYNDFACRNETRRKNNDKLVNKGDFACCFAERKDDGKVTR